MTFASTWFDLVVGVDIHFEVVPMVPAPVPFPHPYVGMVFDVQGALFEAAVGAMVDLAYGRAPAPAGKVLINSVPATVTGTAVTNHMALLHMPLPPGAAWAPVPRAPLPKVGLRGKAGPPPLPTTPPGDALLLMGAKNVQMMGSNPVRLGDIALSCSDPVRLPTSTVIAIPKGRPVVINGPPAVNWGQAAGMLAMNAALKGLRSVWTATKLHRLVSRWSPTRLRNIFHKTVCFLTGHPVDVASGRVLTTMPGFTLPAPIPLDWTAEYVSSWSHRQGALGWGWAHPFEQAVWTEPGKVVSQAEDGREIEFTTMEEPEHRAWDGTTIYEPVSRLTLRRRRPKVVDGESFWEVETHDGLVHEFRRIVGEPANPDRPDVARIVSTRSRDGQQHTFAYEQGRLARVNDGAGRTLTLEYDSRGRIDRLLVPHPDRADEAMVAQRFVYSAEGDLTEVHDALGNATRYEYLNHLLVRETNRNGLSFYFSYDGIDSTAKCVRTWGDGGIFDHVIDYVPGQRMTIVTNSLKASTAYHMDPVGAVVKIMDALGAVTEYSYDDDLRLTSERDALGNVTRFEYDERGNGTAVIDPAGATTRIEYDSRNNPVRLTDAIGYKWLWEYDGRGRRVKETDPEGHATCYEYDDNTRLLREIAEPSLDRRTKVTYDNNLNVTIVRTPGGADWKRRFDSLGRVVEETNPTGHVRNIRRDKLGRPITVSDSNNTHTLEYDGEGNVTSATDGIGSTFFDYSGFNWLRTRREPGDPFAEIQFEHDTEGSLITVRNEAGERYRYLRDPLGDVIEEIGFDGLRRKYKRDKAGQVAEVRSPSGTVSKMLRDPCGRVVEIERPEGKDKFRWRADGALVEATNPTMKVEFERDAFGRVIVERRGDDHWVTSFFRPGATHRYLMKSSLGARMETKEDADGNPIAFKLSTRGTDPIEIALKRDALGQEVERHLPGGVVAFTDRDKIGRPVRQWTERAGEELTSRAYTWKFDDRLSQIQDRAFGVSRFQHDERRRLVFAEFEGGQKQWRAPDVVGNVYKTPERSDRRYEVGGRLVEIDGRCVQYDGDGNVVRLPALEGDLRLAYSSNGTLAKAIAPDGTESRYEYDALRRRILKTANGLTTVIVWDAHDILHEQRVGEDASSLFVQQGFIPLAEFNVSGRKIRLTDQIGAPSVILDGAAGVSGELQLDLFGVPRSRGARRQEDSVDAARWPGQRHDPESGLAYNRFRYYAPSSGTYVSQDPLRLLGGLRLYGYSHDPLVWADPFGLTCDAYHATSSPRGAQGVLGGIDTDFLKKQNRFGAAFYIAKNPGTTLAELGHHGIVPTHGIRFAFHDDKAKILDLTDPATAGSFGYRAGSKYNKTSRVATKARQAGFNVIKYESVRSPGSINFAVLGDFGELLEPQMVTPI